GCGIVIDPFRVAPDTLLEAVKTVLADDRYRRRCGELRQAFAACDGFGEAVRLVERLGETRGRVGREAA
ncbi:MAG TPA: hypothetical protein VFX98_20000, partial [Longimicrobiaceae bacterium]|nr:hypothetical protein [Longimicrobiaceae bacterium]